MSHNYTSFTFTRRLNISSFYQLNMTSRFLTELKFVDILTSIFFLSCIFQLAKERVGLKRIGIEFKQDIYQLIASSRFIIFLVTAYAKMSY